MERPRGFEPPSPGWQPGILAAGRRPHVVGKARFELAWTRSQSEGLAARLFPEVVPSGWIEHPVGSSPGRLQRPPPPWLLLGLVSVLRERHEVGRLHGPGGVRGGTAGPSTHRLVSLRCLLSKVGPHGRDRTGTAQRLGLGPLPSWATCGKASPRRIRTVDFLAENQASWPLDDGTMRPLAGRLVDPPGVQPSSPACKAGVSRLNTLDPEWRCVGDSNPWSPHRQ